MHYVYTLADPRTNAVRYVGITKDPQVRLMGHISPSRKAALKTTKYIWIQGLLAEGLKPVMQIVEKTEDREKAIIKERIWTRYYLNQGALLTNVAGMRTLARGLLFTRNYDLSKRNKKSNLDEEKQRIALKPTTFSEGTIQDLPEVVRLLETFFTRADVEKYTDWVPSSEETCYILKSNNEIVGCAFVLLEDEKISQTLPYDRDLHEIERYCRLYIRSVVVLQSVGKLQRRYWAARLISELVRELVNLGARGIVVDKIYAQTDGRNVERLLKVMGFTQMVSPTTARNFVLDIATSGSIYAMMYKRALDKWQEE